MLLGGAVLLLAQEWQTVTELAGVEGTPTVFLNGQKYNGDLAPDAIKPVIDGELKRLAAKK